MTFSRRIATSTRYFSAARGPANPPRPKDPAFQSQVQSATTRHRSKKLPPTRPNLLSAASQEVAEMGGTNLQWSTAHRQSATSKKRGSSQTDRFGPPSSEQSSAARQSATEVYRANRAMRQEKGEPAIPDAVPKESTNSKETVTEKPSGSSWFSFLWRA